MPNLIVNSSGFLSAVVVILLPMHMKISWLFSVSMTGNDIIDKVQTIILSCIFQKQCVSIVRMSMIWLFMDVYAIWLTTNHVYRTKFLFGSANISQKDWKDLMSWFPLLTFIFFFLFMICYTCSSIDYNYSHFCILFTFD